ncbi:MAG: hypothetical protein HY683_09830 [Chloroflexi bacterium]|nr:hypothetical protein [Chloroflexota bacterium]
MEVPRVEYEKLTGDATGEPSEVVRARVQAAREQQRRRFAGTPLLCNAEMGPAQVWQVCKLESGA